MFAFFFLQLSVKFAQNWHPLAEGYDPKGQSVDYLAKGWEARLLQQAGLLGS